MERLLIEEHVPFDLLVAEDAKLAQKLAQYELVIMPGITHLSDSAATALRDFVKRGGKLLATAKTSLFDDRGSSRTNFALADVLGVNFKGEAEEHFAIDRGEDAEPASGVFVQVSGRASVGAYRFDTDPPENVGGGKDPMPTARSQWPAYTTHSFGDGKATYVAFDIGRYFETHGDEHIGSLMRELIDGLMPERQIRTNAPNTLEVTLWRQPGEDRTIIHLANRTVPWTMPTLQRQFTHIIPLHDVHVELKSPKPGAKVSGRQSELTTRAEGDTLHIDVEKLGPYAAIVID